MSCTSSAAPCDWVINKEEEQRKLNDVWPADVISAAWYGGFVASDSVGVIQGVRNCTEIQKGCIYFNGVGEKCPFWQDACLYSPRSFWKEHSYCNNHHSLVILLCPHPIQTRWCTKAAGGTIIELTSGLSRDRQSYGFTSSWKLPCWYIAAERATAVAQEDLLHRNRIICYLLTS